jgi:hypothetical protein
MHGPNDIILPMVLYGCDSWSLTLKEEHRLRVFENRVLRRIFGLKRDEVMGENCILRSFITCTLFNNYSDQVKENEMGRASGMNGEKRNAYRTLMRQPEGKKPLGRPRCNWVDNIKMDLKETGRGVMD